jgi:segregation and condensation protein B
LAEFETEQIKDTQLPPPSGDPDEGGVRPVDEVGIDPELPIPRGEEVLAVTEALLFATTQPLSIKRLSLLMNGVPEEEVEAAIKVLTEQQRDATRGLVLMEVAGGWQVATKPEVADWVLRLHKHRRKNPLTPSLMESLAIVAYKQPITRADVEAIRGVDCSSAIRSLQDAGLCEIVGRKEVVGRPPLYGTTDLFLKTFGLRSIEELPTTGSFREILEQKATPPETPPDEPALPEETPEANAGDA